MQEEFEAYLKCGRLEHGFLRLRIAAHLIKKAGLTHATGAAGAMTLVQRFGSALNANVRFHMLVLDGVYLAGEPPPRL